jgi:hypothetical protein
MYQVVEQTYEEKFAMYLKLSKRELIEMLIEANKHIALRPLNYTPFEVTGFLPVEDICPKNGGSGICNCTMPKNML